MRSALNTVTVVSATFLGIAVTLFVAGYFFNAWDYRLSLSNEFHIGLWNQGFDSRIVFFNNAEYGPYRGSLIGLDDGEGNIYPPLKCRRYFGDSWGIYYRYFEWFDQPKLWTLMVSLWNPIIGFALLPTIQMYARMRRRTAEADIKALQATTEVPS